MQLTERLLREHAYIVGRSIASLGLATDPEVEDLEQEARLALLKAAHEFDPERGHKFSSFAIPRVRGAILEYRRSRCSWVRRAGQNARAHVDAALLALELRGEPLTEAAVRALLADPRDYDRAAALPALVPLLDEDGGSLLGELADGAPDLVEVAWQREGEALIERAIKRLTALDRAVFRGCIERGMRVGEVAERLDIPPGEVTRRRREALAALRQFLKRVSARFVKNDEGLNQRRKMAPRGRPAGAQKTERVNYLADSETRERALRLAAKWDVSEAEVNRRGIEALWQRENRGGAASPRKK